MITYLPTSRTIAIDMSKLAGITTAGSFDPMNGSYVAAAGSPFVNAGDRQFTPLVSRQQQRGRWRLGAAARGRGSAKVIISIRRIFRFGASSSHLSSGESHMEKVHSKSVLVWRLDRMHMLAVCTSIPFCSPLRIPRFVPAARMRTQAKQRRTRKFPYAIALHLSWSPLEIPPRQKCI